LRGLQLKPLHDALREVIAAPILEPFYAKPAAASKKSAKKPAAADDGQKLSAELNARVRTLLERSRQLYATDHPRAASTGVEPWNGDVETAITAFEERLKLAQKLGEVEKQFGTPWPAEAHKVLPTAEAAKEKLPQAWAAVAAWSALLAIGEYADPTDAECAASRIIDQQRLREPIAEALEHLGLHGEERWRVAARIRTLLAHKPWAPGSDLKKAKAPFSWLHDSEVAWLIGVHAYEDVRYFNKESFEQLLWWMALPALLSIAAATKPDPTTIETVEEQIEARTKAAAAVSYQLDGLFDAATAVVKEKQPSKA